MAKDTSTLFMLAFLFILVILFLTFRRVTDVLFTMLVVIVTIIWVMGLSGWVHIPFTLTALIIGAGIDFGIHVTHRFREEWALGCEDIDQAVRLTVGNVGRALLSAAVTTAGAFGILAISRVQQMRRFGGVTALSLVFALLVALLVLPTILSLWAERKNNARSEEYAEE